jgi:hypothetical protein
MALTPWEIGGGSGHLGGTRSYQNLDTAQRTRYYGLAHFMEGAAGVNEFTTSRPGVLPGPADASSGLPVAMLCSYAGSGLNVSIRPGAAVVERSTLVGPYLVTSNQTAMVTLATPDSTNSRVDCVYVQILDGALGDSGGTKSQFLPVTGTGTPVGGVIPAAPAPPNSILLCQVTVPPNVANLSTATFADKRRSAAVRGAVRLLLPGDSLSDPGFMVGELRDTSVLQSPGTVDRWDAVANAWVREIDLGVATTAYYQCTNEIPTSGTNTTYADLLDSTATRVGVVFTAPASGRIKISWGGNFRFNSSSGGAGFVGSNVGTGGTIGSGLINGIIAGDYESLEIGPIAATGGMSRKRFVAGLTPGSTYNAWLAWRSTNATTRDALGAWVSVEPVAR